jgi:hypothetical protein
MMPIIQVDYTIIQVDFTNVDIVGMYIGLCLEWFLYGKIFVPCVPLSNEV